MRCTFCANEAVLRLRHANLRLCPEHLVARVEKEAERAIREFRMFTPEEKILVAVSGGKDSLGLWAILTHLGYKADGLYIDLGIAGYSRRSREFCEEFARARGLPLHVVALAEEVGAGLDEIAATLRGEPCAHCGALKRYLMNRVAWEGGYAALATGHNLDDEAATLLGNTLRWDLEYLARQYPVLPAGPKLARKVKPLVFLSEREMVAYCLIRGIRYIYEECPHSVGARSLFLKDILNRLEDAAPSTKITFLKAFLRVHPQLPKPKEVEVRDCPSCGMPTAAQGPCRFCRIRERMAQRAPA
ncbi:MAG: adenine nucleotide alpha hydrolase family protein [Candidatus Bipolaricaulota bacterium]|nr:adenine nucleotide alpha hydrolase family protein [Candidatus Bipolaricaulota bacterium]